MNYSTVCCRKPKYGTWREFPTHWCVGESPASPLPLSFPWGACQVRSVVVLFKKKKKDKKTKRKKEEVYA
jgi:hypothetical protein